MKNVWQEKPGARAQNTTPPQQLYSAAVKKNTKHDSSAVTQGYKKHTFVQRTELAFQTTLVTEVIEQHIAGVALPSLFKIPLGTTPSSVLQTHLKIHQLSLITIANSISASPSTRIINTPHLHLPDNIQELIGAKNRFRKLWNNTRYPPYKREVNALVRQIRKEIEVHKNRTWKDFLLTLNPQDNYLYNLHRKITKRATVIPPLHGPGGIAYSDFKKAEAFKDTLEVTFQENMEPYCDDKIEEVENVVSNYFDNFTTIPPLLTSPTEVRGIIKKLQNRKAAGPT
ncbi:uncharacterized protein TNCV_4042631 [Trichonephila clavipes]|nr:uncharacterized protein TNCV_4042631 [Trichonephila clavipes]